MMKTEYIHAPPSDKPRSGPALPHKLYGRDRDITKLIASFERAGDGHGEVLLLSGASGVGKTALVQALQIPIRNSNGFLIKGKFEQYQQNIPYFAFRQALTELCQELLNGDAQRRSRFKADILQAVGNLGQVLVDLVPEFGTLLGTQPPLERISAQEARHRFTDVLCNLLKVVCRPEHPLVLFIDDWQWADVASCELFKHIQAGVTLHYLLVVASYRDNEVNANHPLMSAIDDLRSHAVPVEALEVRNITAQDVQAMVADTQRPATENLEGLAALIHGQTLGNPFFVRSFLIFLHESSLIWFDPARASWRWHMDQAGGEKLPGDAVALFVLKLRRLDPGVQNLFSLAACIGNRFDVDTLSMISGRDSEACMQQLSSEQAQEMLLPLEGVDGNLSPEDPPSSRVFAFLHDRIQQAAYTLIDPAERPNIRLKLGRLLLANLAPQQLAERLFEVVNDMNAGWPLLQDEAERMKVVELNIAAGRKATAATAYGAALQYYRAASAFLETPGLAERLWCDCHELTMQLFTERAECEFIEGCHTEADECIQQAVAHARTAIEKAAALNVLIVQYTLLARYPEAITVGREALSTLGVSLPDEGYEEVLHDEIACVREALGDRAIASLIDLPLMRNPEMLLASKLLITLGPPCYRSHQRLWGVIVVKVVNLILRYGNIPQVGYSHTAFGGLLGWVENDYTTARQFGELATRLMAETFRTASDQSVFYLMIGSSIRHWFKHLKYSTQDYTDAYEIGLRSGNLQYAAYAFGHNMYCRFYQGVPLAGLIRETQRSLEFSRTRTNQWAVDLLEGGLRVFGALSGKDSASNGNDAGSEQQFLQRVEDHHNIQVTCIYKVLKTFSLLVSGDCEGALVASDEAEPLIYTVGTQGLLPWPEHVFARFLILTALYSKAEERQQTQWRTELNAIIVRLRIWADNCPDNFEHKYLLAAAELARIDGRSAEAMQLYDRAVEAAQAGCFLQWESVANERASAFWLERGNERLAHIYWQQAYVCYNRWGAVAKVSSMEAEYRTALAESILACEGTGTPTEMQELDITIAPLETQVKQLRKYAIQEEQARLRIETASQAEELADAMQRVRVEIAERKKAEAALSNAKALLDATGQMAKVGGWEIDLSSQRLTWTREVYRIHEVSEDFQPTVAAGIDFYAPESKPIIAAAVQRTIERGEVFDVQLEIITARKNRRWVNARGEARSQDGKIVSVVGTFQDITELKQSEDERRGLEKQLHEKRKLAAVGTLACGMGHEINNPLMGIINYAQLIKDGLQGKDETLEEFTGEIVIESERIAGIVRKLSAFASRDMGDQVSVTVADLVDSALAPLRAALTDDHVVIEVDVPDNLPSVVCDRGQIEQVLTSLLKNAQDALNEKYPEGDDDKIIVVSAELGTRNAEGRWECGSEAADPNSDTPSSELRLPTSVSRILRLTVADHGAGIADAVRERIFEPFFTTKDISVGAGSIGKGLGLFVSHATMQEHGGNLSVESEPGQWTRFHVELPIDASR